MICPTCGKEVEDWQKFCSGCGTRMTPPEEVAPVSDETVDLPEVPAEPVYEAPAEPVYEAPAEPAYEAPAEPVYEAPAEPAYEAPAQPTYYAPPVYAAPAAPVYAAPAPTRPVIQLPTGRSLLKMIFLSIITFGIYPIVIYSKIVTELNIVASRYDGKRTMPFLAVPYLGSLTLGIYMFVWEHKMCNRIGAELDRRGIKYKFSARTFWFLDVLWSAIVSVVISIVGGVIGFESLLDMEIGMLIVVGVAICVITCVGPFLFLHKLMKSMNLLNADFNRVG